MLDLWRISNYQSLNGEGGRRSPARWHSGGAPIVYLAASPPGALIEILAHLEITEATLPPTYTLLHITAPNQLRVPVLEVPEGDAWKADSSVTRQLGDAWLASQRSVLAQVPSAILPETFNFLLNPLHRDAPRIRMAAVHQAFLDPRLLRKPPSSPRTKN